MVIVGFHDGGALSSGLASDEVEYNKTCRWATEAETLTGDCLSDQIKETIEPNRFGEENRKCCSYEAMEPMEFNNSDRDWENSYWIVQNSFSGWWGDNGFMHKEASRTSSSTGAGASLRFALSSRRPTARWSTSRGSAQSAVKLPRATTRTLRAGLTQGGAVVRTVSLRAVRRVTALQVLSWKKLETKTLLVRGALLKSGLPGPR